VSCDVKRNGYNMYHFLNVNNSAFCSSYVYVGIMILRRSIVDFRVHF